jgi:hypothetical protein
MSEPTTENQLEAQIIDESIAYLHKRFDALLTVEDITPWAHVIVAAEDRADWLRENDTEKAE